MSPARRALLAICLSLLSALFFTATYVLNRAAAVEGGHWAWTAALRYLFVLPLLLPLMPWQGGIAPVCKAIRAAPGAWLLWSGIGFVGFYMLLTYAAARTRRHPRRRMASAPCRPAGTSWWAPWSRWPTATPSPC